MKPSLLVLTFSLGIPLIAATWGHAQESAATLAHMRTEFAFTVDAPFEQVVPLFGAHEERKWADDWNPHFLYPTPAHDQQGMVFTVAHGQRTSVWINTARRTCPVCVCPE